MGYIELLRLAYLADKDTRIAQETDAKIEQVRKEARKDKKDAMIRKIRRLEKENFELRLGLKKDAKEV